MSSLPAGRHTDSLADAYEAGRRAGLDEAEKIVTAVLDKLPRCDWCLGVNRKPPYNIALQRVFIRDSEDPTASYRGDACDECYGKVSLKGTVTKEDMPWASVIRNAGRVR